VAKDLAVWAFSSIAAVLAFELPGWFETERPELYWNCAAQPDQRPAAVVFDYLLSRGACERVDRRLVY
jgi:hypothetical protein